jgi:hypothetical protein
VPKTTYYPRVGVAPLYPGQACRTKVRLNPGLSLPQGTVLAERNARPGIFVPYDFMGVDGTQVPKLILEFDTATDAAGNATVGGLVAGSLGITWQRVSAFSAGSFRCEELAGLDGGCLRPYGPWRLVEGTVAAGVLCMGG